MIFVDTWALVALACSDDHYYSAATKQHRRLLKKLRRYVTTSFVLTEVITHLYRRQPPAQAQQFVNALLAACQSGRYLLVEVSADQFGRAWQLRQKYDDRSGYAGRSDPGAVEGSRGAAQQGRSGHGAVVTQR